MPTDRAVEPFGGAAVGDAERLGRLDKLLILERLVAVRLEQSGVRETAGLSRELRDCWREIEELMSIVDDAGDSGDDELAGRRERVAAAREAAAKAAASS